MTNNKSSVGVLGAGISGLATAYALVRKGIDVTIYEQEDQAGGSIRTGRSGGWLLEYGPNTLMVRSDTVWNLIDELGLNTEVQEASRIASKRFIVKNGMPKPLPMSLKDFLTTDLLSASAKLRLFKEPFISGEDKDDESIADFIQRRLGKEVLDYAINPFVAGIYAGDPKKLSVKHTFNMLFELEQQYGSISWGMLKRDRKTSAKKSLISFTDGLQTLADKLAEKLDHSLKLNHRISRLQPSGNKWEVHFHNHDSVLHDALISCLPAHVLSNVMNEENEASPAGKLENITYAPMSVLHLGYEKSQISHPLDGFGMLVPEVEEFEILGALFSSSLFPGRAPDGHALLTVFVGGSRYPELAHLSKEELVEKVQLELDRLLAISGTPTFTAHTYWKEAIPQYEVGYDTYLATMEKIEEENRGLFITGNIRGGVSVPDCITGGFETAEKAVSLLKG
ncbi:MAG: protoporphyrinogen oxidase [Balneolaceae bacterium]|nr:protoporphyrinogen oxidase [Balneolaceae bacterium]